MGMGLHVIPHNEHGIYNFKDTKISQEQHLELLFEKLRKNRKVSRIAIFCHGGLNTQGSSRKSGEQICREMIEQSGGKIFPIAITWRSGFGTTYKDSLFKVRAGLQSGTLLTKAWTTTGGILWKFPSDLISGFSRAPQDGLTSIHNTIQNWDSAYELLPDAFPQKQAYVQALSRDFKAPGSPRRRELWTNSFDNLNLPLSRPARNNTPTTPWFRTSVGKAVPTWDFPLTAYNVVMSPIKFTSLPLVTSLGRPAWENMTRRTRTLVRPDRTTGSFADQTPVLAEICRKLKHTRKGRRLTIELYGHSMGSMVFNELLGEVLEQRITDPGFDKIVYMAAACSIKDFNSAVGGYLRKRPRTKVVNLCLHPDCEVREIFKPCANLAISGSLLVWIDSFYDNPRSRLDRTLGSYVNAMTSWKYLPASQNFILKAFGMQHRSAPNLSIPTPGEDGMGKDYNAGPQKHGHFTDFQFWTDYYQGIKPAAESPRYLKYR